MSEGLPPSLNLQTMFLILAGASLLLASAVLSLAVRVRRLTRPRKGEPGQVAAASTADLERRFEHLSGQVRALRSVVERSIQHVGMVRYDAFQDVGGHISFSLALLDEQRNGVVVSVLNGREGSRGYAKTIQGGRSSLPLSEEEERALAQALERDRSS
jgi:hypothetical protein